MIHIIHMMWFSTQKRILQLLKINVQVNLRACCRNRLYGFCFFFFFLLMTRCRENTWKPSQKRDQNSFHLLWCKWCSNKANENRRSNGCEFHSLHFHLNGYFDFEPFCKITFKNHKKIGEKFYSFLWFFFLQYFVSIKTSKH